MLDKLLYYFKFFLKKVKGSIAFYPTVVSLAVVGLGIILMATDNSELSNFISSRFPLIIVNNIDTSRTILGALIGALISLMVFSFSMVMVVLNQAANSFSPRLLPGLISNKRHQIVLGFYLGSILHCMITLLRMEPSDYNDYLPALGVLYAIILGMVCLALFIYFIHSISESIQISKIVYNIYKKTKKEIIDLQEQESISYVEEPEVDWESVELGLVGYVRDFNLKKLAHLNEELEVEIKTSVPEGFFVSLNSPVFYTSRELDEKEKKRIRTCILIDDEEWIGEHPNLGIKQLVEIILKAMSPGINDPGTALTGLDYLTNLLRERKKLRKFNCYTNENGGRVFIKSLSFPKLLKLCFAAIRQYVRHDLIIMTKLLSILDYLKKDESGYEDILFVDAIKKEAKILMEDAEAFIENRFDRDYLKELYKKYDF